MPARRVVPEQKLDYHINFTLQQSIGQQFQEICKQEDVSIQEKLRYLVAEYVDWKAGQPQAIVTVKSESIMTI